MITKTHRFHGHNSLKYVYTHGKQVRGTAMGLKFSPNTKRSSYRCAVVVGKKVNKSAVVRNRIRRRVYEIVRQTDIKGAYDLVFTIFHEDVAGLPADKLSAAVSQLLEDAKVT